MPAVRFFFITNSAPMAQFAIEQGVDRVFVDLELIGKVERQGHLSTVISRHTLADVAQLRAVVPPGRLMVRINPPHGGTPSEVDAVIAAGADILMLPMWRSPGEVQAFVDAVGGRAKTSLLVETVDAMHALADSVRIAGVDEAHIGLNDLHLELRRRFMFELLADGEVDAMAATLRNAGIPFGIGGVARTGEGQLPADLLLSEHARLGSTAAILSRTFHRQAATVDAIRSQMDFAQEILRLRAAFDQHKRSGEAALDARRAEVAQRIRTIAATLPARHG